MKNENQERKFYDHKPIKEFKAKISKDGKYWLFKEITTHVVPRNYISKIESQFVIENGSKSVSRDSNNHKKVERRNDNSNR